MSDKHEHQITTTPSPSAPAHGSEPEPPHGTAAGEAHHAEHASHDTFARRVAISMVVIAAVLAAVKVLGHRAHNDTLRFQIEAGKIHTEADTLQTQVVAEKAEAAGASTRESNQWALFQSKKFRQHLYETQSDLMWLIGKKDDDTKAKMKKWKEEVERYKAEQDEPATEARKFKHEEEEHRKKAEKLHHEAEKKEHEAEHLEHQSHKAHAQSDRYDLGEMGVELALVLASVAILTRRPEFWYGGMALGVVGALIAGSGLFVT